MCFSSPLQTLLLGSVSCKTQQIWKVRKHNIDDSCSEGDNYQARGHQSRDGDVRGPRELHEDEHLPRELGPLVLAKTQVRP